MILSYYLLFVLVFVGHLRDVRRLVVAMSRALSLNEATAFTDRHVDDTGPTQFVSGVDEMADIVNYKIHQVYQALSNQLNQSSGQVFNDTSEENGVLRPWILINQVGINVNNPHVNYFIS